MFIVIYRTNYITLSYHVKFHFKNLANSFQVTDNFIIEKYEQKIQKNSSRGQRSSECRQNLITSSVHRSYHMFTPTHINFWSVVFQFLRRTDKHTDTRTERTKYSAISERPRCRLRYSFGQKWKTITGRQSFKDIIGLSSTTVI